MKGQPGCCRLRALQTYCFSQSHTSQLMPPVLQGHEGAARLLHAGIPHHPTPSPNHTHPSSYPLCSSGRKEAARLLHAACPTITLLLPITHISAHALCAPLALEEAARMLHAACSTESLHHTISGISAHALCGLLAGEGQPDFCMLLAQQPNSELTASCNHTHHSSCPLCT